MKSERGSAGFVGVVSVAALVLVLLMTGCGTMKYGDGKAGSYSLDPAFEALAKAADSRVPGSGDRVRQYFAGAGAERVPPGYAVETPLMYPGIGELDRKKITLGEPRLVKTQAVEIGPFVDGETAVSDVLTEIDAVRSNIAPSVSNPFDAVGL